MMTSSLDHRFAQLDPDHVSRWPRHCRHPQRWKSRTGTHVHHNVTALDHLIGEIFQYWLAPQAIRAVFIPKPPVCSYREECRKIFTTCDSGEMPETRTDA